MTADNLRDFTLNARKILIAEVEDQLEGVYGFLADGHFEPAENYTAIKHLPECRETRDRLETLIADETVTGFMPNAARRKLAKETAFTWLNRLVAFKMMEARKLIRQTISKGVESNGFKMWLTEPDNEQHLHDYEQGDLPQNTLGEGPRRRAYRQFILAQCNCIAQEIRVLFDPDNLPSRLFPRPLILSQLIDMMNVPDLHETWQAGNESTIGWVYQFFIEEEKKDIFDRLYTNKQKIQAEEISAATQIFTPRWIVKFLVHNSLGRLWIQMHPNSILAKQLDYLVPLSGAIPSVPVKPVREITLLDPACGTMHFGLVAFDLFMEMYREEIVHAGQPGWPNEASIGKEEDIPAAILAHNMYGIDIDLRAVQLSALTLFLKAKMANPKTHLTESRLACADIHMLDGQRLKTFLAEAGIEQPIYNRILTALQERLTISDQLGSLLRLDSEIRELIKKERQRYELEGRQKDFFGWSMEQFETEAGRHEFWETLEIQIGQALEAFVKEQAQHGHDQLFFAGETSKGLRLLEIMTQRYNVVVTNPPYMTNRNMNPVMVNYLKKEFSYAKRDLYAAFIQRCMEFLADDGRLGMITQQSFMFISSYENLRDLLRNRIAIETMCHVGPRAFEEVSGEKVNTTLSIFRREMHEQIRQEAIGIYFRLVKEPDAEAKRVRFEQALQNIHTSEPDSLIFRYHQIEFDAIPGSPWVYWVTPTLRQLFQTSQKLEEVAKPRVGLQTGKNERFLRYWWEVGRSLIAFGCRDAAQALTTGKKWFPYMKGGTFRRWYGNQAYIVNWARDGEEIKNIGIESGRVASRAQNTDYYFHRGVTYSYLTGGKFNARLSPGGFIFDVAGSSLFPRNTSLILALMNSSFAFYILRLINPTVNFQVGDLYRLPIVDCSSETLEELITRVIEISKRYGEETDTTYDFISPFPWLAEITDLSSRPAQQANLENGIDDEVYRLYGISEDDQEAIKTELSESDGLSENDEEESSIPNDDEEESGQEDNNEIISRESLATHWISYAVGIAMDRFQPGIEGALGRGNFPPDISQRLRELADADGILVQDEGHGDDLAAKTLAALRIMLGDKEAQEVVQFTTGREGENETVLRKYLETTFFKEHIRQYRKRPVYWLLQSPRKKFGIWIFHERLTGDSLYRIQREYVDAKIRLLETQLTDLRKTRDSTTGRERRIVEKQIDSMEDILSDIQDFTKRLDAVIQRGYTPHIDDGVLLNMAPLWELIPSWQAEPKKAWQALERGDYDWAQRAMDYWPERVKEQCKTNKSFAIAHELA